MCLKSFLVVYLESIQTVSGEVNIYHIVVQCSSFFFAQKVIYVYL